MPLTRRWEQSFRRRRCFTCRNRWSAARSGRSSSPDVGAAVRRRRCGDRLIRCADLRVHIDGRRRQSNSAQPTLSATAPAGRLNAPSGSPTAGSVRAIGESGRSTETDDEVAICASVAVSRTGKQVAAKTSTEGSTVRWPNHSEPPNRRKCASIDTKSRVRSHSPIRGGRRKSAVTFATGAVAASTARGQGTASIHQSTSAPVPSARVLATPASLLG